MKDFLRIFGSLINCIDFGRTSEDETVDDDVQNMIADYCVETLTYFKLSSDDSVVNLNTPSPLRVLGKLHLSDVNVSHFDNISELKSLTMTG